jgi:hypothetical protein
MCIGVKEMKTVIVLDTEDIKGLKAAIRIAKHLEREYVEDMPDGYSTKYSTNDLSFSKIPFIKMLRAFASQIKEDIKNGDMELENISGLRYTKQFSDKVWNREKL